MIGQGGNGSGLPKDPGAGDNSSSVVNAAGRVIGFDGGIVPTGGIAFRGDPNGTIGFVGVGTCPNRFPPPPAAPSQLSPGAGPTKLGSSNVVLEATNKCIASFHLRSVITYQPSSHYWPLHWYAAGIFLPAAAIIGGLNDWWVLGRLP
jgi:hypothetical protein